MILSKKLIKNNLTKLNFFLQKISPIYHNNKRDNIITNDKTLIEGLPFKIQLTLTSTDGNQFHLLKKYGIITPKMK